MTPTNQSLVKCTFLRSGQLQSARVDRSSCTSRTGVRGTIYGGIFQCKCFLLYFIYRCTAMHCAAPEYTVRIAQRMAAAAAARTGSPAAQMDVAMVGEQLPQRRPRLP